MPKHTTQNEADRITIEAELPVPLEELALYTLPKKVDATEIVNLLDTKPHVANYVIGKTAKRIISNKKLDVKLKNLEYDYMDSSKLSHGVAYFKVTLEGTEKALKKIAGEDRVFSFDWQKLHAD
jgi:hypothetical protein